MYKVLIRFKDKNHQVVYEKGDTYPRKGIQVSDERLRELESGDNPLAQAVIEKIEEEKKEEQEAEKKPEKADKKTSKKKGK